MSARWDTYGQRVIMEPPSWSVGARALPRNVYVACGDAGQAGENKGNINVMTESLWASHNRVFSLFFQSERPDVGLDLRSNLPSSI